jgi:hypothetical protein
LVGVLAATMVFVSAIALPIACVAIPAVWVRAGIFSATAGDPAESRKGFQGAKRVPFTSSTVSRAAVLIVARRLFETAVECFIINMQSG